MKAGIILVAATVGLAACNRPLGSRGHPDSHGRYGGIGIYSPGQMWAQIGGPDTSKSPNQATLKDDEEIIVVIDSQTGEVRQCGNLSGYCVTMAPWAKAQLRASPLTVTKHAEQLAEEEAAKAAQSPHKPR